MPKGNTNTKRLQHWRRVADRALTNLQVATATLGTARKEMVVCEEHVDDCDEAQQIIQAVAATIQEEAHDRIAGVVTRCLGLVFGEDSYEFKIHFERTRGRTEARLVFAREGVEVGPLDASGGGVVDVAAFALRLACLMLARPAVRRVVVLDEPFRFVSEGYQSSVREMLEMLAKDMDVQFIMVTHNEAYQCGTVIDVQ